MSIKGRLDSLLGTQKLTWLDGLVLLISSLTISLVIQVFMQGQLPSLLDLVLGVPAAFFGQWIIAGCFLLLNILIYGEKGLDIVKAVRYVALIGFIASSIMTIVCIFGRPPDGWYRGYHSHLN